MASRGPLIALFFAFSLLVNPLASYNPPAAAAAAGLNRQPAAQASSHVLVVSQSSNRSNPVDLQGRTTSGNVYVFVSPESGASQVRFYLDNTSASGTALWTENNAPWDFAGGSTTAANPYDTKKLADGSHSITASISLSGGGTAIVTASFAVSNSVAPTATATKVPPTATTAPTATAVPPTATTVSTATAVPPTATTASTATPTKVPATATPTLASATATPQTSTYSNLVSKSSNRSSAVGLHGQTVSGNIYVFASPDSGVSQVRFYLDNTSASGTPVQTENTAPWDYAGGSVTAATAYDTTRLSNGSHSITAAITLTSGATTVTTATFNVNNTASPTATPVAPTPTGIAPTATAPAPVASGSIYWGVNIQGVPWDLTKLSNWERDVAGKAVSIVHWGHTWENNGSYRKWSNSPVNNARSHGSIPMISWTPEGADNTRYQLGDIIRGDHDAYIRQFATDAKNWGNPYFLRIMHEMNGAWGYPWQEDVNGNKRGEFVQAWRHIIDVFRSVGATNASYVWCPNIEFPNSPNPTYASLYPGDSYVDWSCLDGYNWGTARSTGWQTFDQVFSYSYNEVLKVAPSKPMMLGEFGSVEQGGSKANWFTDTLKTQLPGKYNRIRAAVYFNWPFSGVDWRIETSSTAISAWKSGISASYYAPNNYRSITGKVAVP